MEIGIEAARWMVGKALGPVSSGVLEAWAASTELGPNVEALRMELLYAEGMLNNARGRGRGGPDIQNPALSELLQKLRDLAYRADDVLDELDYFRIQDELDGTYHAAGEPDGGCIRSHTLNARHTARAIAKMLGFSKCSNCFARHNEPAQVTRSTRVPCGGDWPCCGVTTCDDDDDEEEDEDRSRGVLCGAVWLCGRASSTPPTNHGVQQVGNGCMGRITSSASGTIHSVGKHFPCCSVSTIQNASANSSIASTGSRFFCCARPNKAPQRQVVKQTSKLKFYRVEMSEKIKDIVDQLKPLCAKVSTILNLELLAANLNNNGQYMATVRPITTSESIEPEFYGREDTTSQLMHDVTMGEYCHVDLTVVPIVGPGGIGKTTFTQHIYKKLHDHFEVTLWVCVSVNFNVSRLMQEIADKIKKEENSSPEKRIEEELKSKRFLLVLDDMWTCSNEDEWKRFLVPFKKGQTKGNVILVTTRFPALAQTVKTTDHWRELKGIEKEEFEKLFFAYVFGNKQPKDDQLLGTGREIIEKLKGSPLAAKTVGRLLRNHLDLGHWTRVLESREWESQSGDHDIMPALKLSFDYLPFHLQQCFTYCSLFPEDYKFSKEEIIHFWIGLDVLHSRGQNKKVEDIGLSYLIELINHGFFKKEEYDNGRTYYVIHDLMHELGLKVSADECLSIYSTNVRSIQILPSIRHLSINIEDSSVNDRKVFDICKEDFSVLGEKLRVENLHSLMVFGKHQGSFAKTLYGLFTKAISLRVIMISGNFYCMEDLFLNFSKLIHLRYLRVHRDWSMEETTNLVASNSISRFYHMRVLDLRGCEDRQNLPKYMSNLLKLRHFLVLGYSVHSKISEVGKLKSLQELQRFEVGKESQGFELSQIGHLLEICGSLTIDNLENVEGREGADEAKLMHKKNLNELILSWNVERSNKDPVREEHVLEGLKPHGNLKKLTITGHGGGACPSWLGLNLSVQNLESLCLDGVDWETFPPIGGELHLVNKGAKDKLSNSPSQHFMNLKIIELANLSSLKRWVVGSSGQLFSHLEVLIIKGCPEFLELAFSDYNYSQQDRKTWPPNLRELVIKDCQNMLSLPPVPWRSTSCSVEISGVGLGFELKYREYYSRSIVLEIIGGVNLDSASFWTRLDFDNLTEVKELTMKECPPLPFDGLQKMTSLISLKIWIPNDIAFEPIEDGRHVGYQFALESLTISGLGATSGKVLTQILSYMPKLSKLIISSSDNITGLGVVEKRSREEEEIEAAEEGLLLLPPQLRLLDIYDCYADVASSSSSRFPTSLQSLCLELMDLTGVSLGRVLHNSWLQELTVKRTINFFSIGPDPILSSSLLWSLETDDATGALAAPICRLLSSSLTKLVLCDNKEMERFTGEQDEALQLLTSLQQLILWNCEKLQSLPAGLHRLTSLKTLDIMSCPSIRFLPTKDGLPNSLQNLTISYCSAIRSLPKDGLPDSLQELNITRSPSIRALPKGVLPTSMKLIDVHYSDSEELKRQCRNLIGTIPIVKA